MDDKERRRLAVEVTRSLLTKAMDDPIAMGYLAIFEVTPQDLENAVGMVLNYLEVTHAKKEEEA